MGQEIDRVHTTTPSGETGIDDVREAMDGHGHGKVSDAAGIKSGEGDRHKADSQPLEDLPTADDPYGRAGDGPQVRKMQRDSEGPTYERGQGTADPSTGGSTDPHNFMTHANSGDETEMSDVDNENASSQSQESVDGFADTEGETTVGSPDPGIKPKLDPLSPEEYAEALKEARSEDDDSGGR